MDFLRFIFNVFFGWLRPHRSHKGKPHQTESGKPNRLNRMLNLIRQIRKSTHDIMHDLEKFEQGNKAAGKRVRKNSIELERLYKEFRKRSVHETPAPKAK